MKLANLITLREIAYNKTPLAEIVKTVASERPSDIEVISADTTSHTYIRTVMDKSELNRLILASIAEQLGELESHEPLEDLNVSSSDAAEAVRNADPFLFFQLEPSFRKSGNGNVYYVEACSA